MEAGTLVVSLGVNPTELQRGLTSALQSLDAFNGDLAQSIGVLGQFGSATDDVGFAYAQLGLELGEVQARLSDLAAAYRMTSDAGRQREIVAETAALREQEFALRQLQAAMRQADDAQAGFTRGSGLANNVALEFSRGLGDLRYGFHGVANNAEQAISQFGMLRQQAGGTRQALAAVGASLMGPIGLVAGFTALTALGPSLASFFSDTEQQAGDTADSIERIANAVKGILEIDTSGLSKFNVTVDGLKVAALQADARVRDLQGRIKDFDIFSTDPNAVRDLNRLKDQLVEAEGAYSAFMREISSRRGTGMAADILRDLGFEEVTDAAGAASKEVEKAASRYRSFAADVRAVLSAIREFRAGLVRPMGTEGSLIPTEEIRAGVSELREIPAVLNEAATHAFSLGDAFRSIVAQSGAVRGFVDDLARSFGDAVFSVFDFGGALSEAEVILARLDFEDTRDHLREAFEEGRITAERYRAELAVLQERQDQFNASISPIARGFRTLADGIVQSMKRVVAAISEAIAKAAILRALTTIFPTGTFLGNIFEGLRQSGGGVGGRPVVPATVSYAPVTTGGRGTAAVDPFAAEVRGMRSDIRALRSDFRSVQYTFADPHAARRLRDNALVADRLTDPRGGTL